MPFFGGAIYPRTTPKMEHQKGHDTAVVLQDGLAKGKAGKGDEDDKSEQGVRVVVLLPDAEVVNGKGGKKPYQGKAAQ